MIVYLITVVNYPLLLITHVVYYCW